MDKVRQALSEVGRRILEKMKRFWQVIKDRLADPGRPKVQVRISEITVSCSECEWELTGPEGSMEVVWLRHLALTHYPRAAQR